MGVRHGLTLFKVDVYIASGRRAYRCYCQERVGGVPGEVGGRAGCIWSFDSVVKIQRHDDAQTQSGVMSQVLESNFARFPVPPCCRDNAAKESGSSRGTASPPMPRETTAGALRRKEPKTVGTSRSSSESQARLRTSLGFLLTVGPELFATQCKLHL